MPEVVDSFALLRQRSIPKTAGNLFQRGSEKENSDNRFELPACKEYR
jgi:hypothetical protein